MSTAREGFGEEEISHQDDGLVAPDGVGGGQTPTHGGCIHHVVMEQGGRMQVFEDGGEIGEMIALAAAQAGRQQKEQGPDALTAA